MLTFLFRGLRLMKFIKIRNSIWSYVWCVVFEEIENNDSYLLNLQNFIEARYLLEQMIFSHRTNYQIIILQTLLASILQKIAFLLSNMYSSRCLNKFVDKLSCQILRRAAKIGYVSDILYLAVYYYKSFQYREALSIIKLAKVKLAKPYIMYLGKPRELC